MTDAQRIRRGRAKGGGDELPRAGGATTESHEDRTPSLGGESQRLLDEEKRKGRLPEEWGGSE